MLDRQLWWGKNGTLLHNYTRMHSSRMRTARLLPVSPSMHCPGGVPGPGGWGLPGPGECTWSREGVPCPKGLYLVLGGVPGLECTWSREGVPGPRGLYLVWGVPGGVYLIPGGVPGPGGGICPDTPPMWTEWQTGVKILPCPKLRFCGR